jgi:RNA polymerase sigma factor (sigma-70 family)
MTVRDGALVGRAVQSYDDDQLVLSAQTGDPDAFGVLFDRWFDRVFDVAYRIVRDQEVAAEITQDVFLVAWTHMSGIKQPASFGGWLLRTVQNRAINRLERERRSIAVDDDELAMHTNRDGSHIDPVEALHQSEQADLVWAAADALGERDASVLDLHLRHGLEAPELAETLGVTVNNAHQMLYRLRKRLGTALRGWVLWRGGEPACRELATGLRMAGITSFGPAAVARIERHTNGCTQCVGRGEQRFAPEALFAAGPLVAVAPWLKAQVVADLVSAGVPLQGSAAVGGGVSGSAGPGDPPAPDGHPGIEPFASDPVDGSVDSPMNGRPPRRWVRRVAVTVAIVAVVTMFVAGPLGPAGNETEERTTVVDDRSTTPEVSAPESTVPSTTTTTTTAPTSTLPPPTTTTTVPAPPGSAPRSESPAPTSTTTTATSTTTTTTAPVPVPPG